MKKTFFSAIILLIMGAAQAQNLSFGPTVGFGHSWLSTNSGADRTNKFHASYNIGGKLVYSFTPNWGVSADLKFSGEGGSMMDPSNEDEIKYIYRANYIRVPLQGIYFFGKLGDMIRPKISIGPSFGFFTGGKYKVEVNGTTVQENPSSDIFTGFDLGLNTAAGANFRMGGNKWLNADITYYHGFSDVSESPAARIRNRGIGLNLGVTFALGTVKPN